VATAGSAVVVAGAGAGAGAATAGGALSTRAGTFVAFGYHPTSATFRCREASAFDATASTAEARIRMTAWMSGFFIAP